MLSFSSTSRLLNNALILETYNELTMADRQPKLALYKENQLVIVSKIAAKYHEFVIEFFKKCFYFLCEKRGLLSYNQDSIQKIEKSIDEFYRNQKTRFNNDLTVEINDKQQKLIELNNKIKESSNVLLEHSTVEYQLKKSQAEIHVLSDKIQAANIALNLLKQQIEEKKQLNEKLNADLKNLEGKKTELDQIKIEISILQPELNENLIRVQELRSFDKSIKKLTEEKAKLENLVTSLTVEIGSYPDKKKAFEEGKKVQQKTTARKAAAEFPERNNWYCQSCINPAAIAISIKRGPVKRGPKVENVSVICQGETHLGERHITSAYRFIKC